MARDATKSNCYEHGAVMLGSSRRSNFSKFLFSSSTAPPSITALRGNIATIEAASVLKARGAVDVQACATHPVFADGAIDNLLDSELSQLVITDTVPLPGNRT